MRASKIKRPIDMNGNNGVGGDRKSNGKTQSSNTEKIDNSSKKVKSARSTNKNSTIEIESENENITQEHTSKDEVDIVNDNTNIENENENNCDLEFLQVRYSSQSNSSLLFFNCHVNTTRKSCFVL